jgi:hypothetical protein
MRAVHTDCPWFGFTKREEFARAAMQGLLANEGEWYTKDVRRLADCAQLSVWMADHLIAALNKEPEAQP